MTKVVNSSEYSANAIFVGCSVNEDGEPLVEINGKAIGTVDGLLDFIGKYRALENADVKPFTVGEEGDLYFSGVRVGAQTDYELAARIRRLTARGLI